MKNLLYIFADQWRYHALGYSKEDFVQTPNMDAFAKESLFFENAISTYPLCSPHRAALLTGKTPLESGFWTNCKKELALSPTLAPQEICFSDVLKENGYDTAYIGKWHLDSSDENFYKTPQSGATNWDAFTPRGERRHGFDYWHSYGAMDNHLEPHYWEDSNQKLVFDKWSPEHEREVLENYLTNIRDKAKPFAAVLSWNPPHPPYDKVPQEFLPLYSKEHVYRANVPQEMKEDPVYIEKFTQYYAAITSLDKQFGLLIEYLKQNNLYEDTTIILSADHGDCMGSHGLYGKNIWYEESIKIPFMIKDKDITPGLNSAIFESRDHAPTILSLLNLAIPQTMTGKAYDKVDTEYAYLCMLPGMPELVEAYSKLGLDSKSFGWRGLRSKDFTYVIDNGIKPNEKQVRYYYNLKEDPLQLKPEILNKEDKRCQQFDAILKQLCMEQKDFFLFDRN